MQIDHTASCGTRRLLVVRKSHMIRFVRFRAADCRAVFLTSRRVAADDDLVAAALWYEAAKGQTTETSIATEGNVSLVENEMIGTR